MAAMYQKFHERFGLGGLDLRRSIDIVDALNATILTNAIRYPDGGWTTRQGQQDLCTAPVGPIHSITRATDAATGISKLYWGAGTTICEGPSSTLATISTDYSGQPMSFVPWQCKLSGESWLIVGDGNKMRKIRVKDNLILPLGLPEPSAAPTVSVAAVSTGNTNKVLIDALDTDSGWTRTVQSGISASAPTVATLSPGKGTAYSVKITTAPTGAISGLWWSQISRAESVDLSKFDTNKPATDDDYIHFWLRFDVPTAVSEVRVYLVTKNKSTGVNSYNTGGYQPGTSATYNCDAYYKAVRPADSTAILYSAPTISVAPIIVDRTSTDDATKDPVSINDNTLPAAATTDVTGTMAISSLPGQGGANAWTEWGSVGVPLRRGDFQSIGDPDWANVTGLIIWMLQSTNAVVNYEIDNLYMEGGSGPDTGEPGTQKYDYVYSNYDPRTFAEGNTTALSHIMPESNWVDSLRQTITVTPSAAGDAAVRQKVYRRGGTLTDNWRYIGMNTSDGGAVVDTLSDTEIAAADTAPIDYYQGVPSVTSASGAPNLAQPVPYVWGPLQGLIFAAGDPNRPGAVYYPYADSVDQWSASGYVDVCSSTEAIIGGFILGSQSFAWSTQRLYALNINLNDASSVIATVTNCTKAPIAPWAHVTGFGANWFLASSGLFMTDGQVETCISDMWVRPLFIGQSSNGLYPIDYSATTAIRLGIYQNELYLTYQDTLGQRQTLIYHLLDRVWRHAHYAYAISAMYTDASVGYSRFLFGTAGGRGMVAGGTADLYSPIDVHIRTPAFNQGYPKSLKRYSDFTMDMNPNGHTITVTPYLSYDQGTQTALTVSDGSVTRQPYIYSFTPVPVLSPTLALDIQYSSSEAPPVVYGVTTTWEVEPPTITRWTSLPTDHGLVGWHLATGMFLSLRSAAEVTLSVTAWGQGGTVLSTHTYAVPGTGGEKFKDYIPFIATKGAFYSYQLSSSAPFTVYSDESTVRVQPWGGSVEGTKDLPLIGLQREGTTAFDTLDARAARESG